MKKTKRVAERERERMVVRENLMHKERDPVKKKYLEGKNTKRVDIAERDHLKVGDRRHLKGGGHTLICRMIAHCGNEEIVY